MGKDSLHLSGKRQIFEGMADESKRKPQAPKKPRRGSAESQEEEWVITPDVIKKIEEGLDKAFVSS